MKKITLTLVAIACALASLAQTGLTCFDAIQTNSTPTCVFTAHTTTGFEMWFSWTATSTDAQITVISEAFGSNLPHIHGAVIYSGTCNNLQAIAEDELVFLANSSELILDISNLSIGNIYFIRLQREATSTVQCDKGACFPVIQNASFVFCIEEIDVFVPPDFGSEVPAKSHIYYTNKGQIKDTDGNPRFDIKLYNINSSLAVYVTNTASSYVLARVDTIPSTLDSLHRVDMRLVGGNPGAKVFKTEKTPGHLNYYLGHIPTGITKMKGYSRAVCNDVYPNIDMQYYSNSKGLKYYFVVHPGGDPDDILIKFEGASAVNVTPTGGLKVITPLGNIEFEAGHAYSVNPPNNIVPMPWQAKFIQVSNNTVKFDVRKYPKFMPLVIGIDQGHTFAPAPGAIDNLDLSTYYGGTSIDEFFDVTTDANGNVYITGITWSLNFPVDTGAFQTFNAGDQDAIVIKLNSNGIRQYATYYGGSQSFFVAYDWGNAIGVDSQGNVFITGRTFSEDLPLLNPGGGAYFDSISGVEDIYIAKFDNSGILKWATYGVLSGPVQAFDLIMDNSGNFYVVGSAASVDLLNPGGGAYFNTSGTGLILKFDTSGVRLWATKYGGTQGGDWIRSAAIDASNNLLITGSAKSITNFPLVNPGGGAYFQDTFGGGLFDAFIAKFDSNDSLIHSTYIGGSAEEQSFGITADVNDNIYITGFTNSNGDFPLFDPGFPAYFDSIYHGEGVVMPYHGDAFICKFSSTGILQASTYYGNSADEVGFNITTDNAGNVYIAGSTTSANFPFVTPNLTNAFVQDVHYNGNDVAEDGFLIVLDSNFRRIWTTFIGGNNKDNCYGVTVFQDSKLYIVGSAYSTNGFPFVDLGGGAWFQDSSAGSFDGFISRFDLSLINPVGVNEIAADIGNDFIIYPNPTDGNVLVEFNLSERDNINLTIYDIRGRELLHKTMNDLYGNQRFVIDLSKYSEGVYLIQITTDIEMFNKKLIITK